ncbi:MAG: F0F1 ATP synthase subunit B [Gemmatimonadota bacterium]|nr:F0F1 ATP synthase subunit B [Gemmatimonadota bacterium]
MRLKLLPVLILAAATPALLVAQGEESRPNPLSVNTGLMFWTLVIFGLLMIVLGKFAFPKLLGAVEARERALQEAIDAAKRDREEAAKLLEEQKRQLEAMRAEAQRYIAEGRQAGENVRTGIIDQAHKEQQDILERARGEIAAERDKAIEELRRQAVDLAIKGAGKVLERNLDDAANRQLVEQFLATVNTTPAKR